MLMGDVVSKLGLQAGDRAPYDSPYDSPAGATKVATAADVLEYAGDIVNGRWHGTGEVFLFIYLLCS